MSVRSFVIAALCIAAGFALFWFHRDGGAMFLTLLGGSPIAGDTGRKGAADAQATVAAGPAEPGAGATVTTVEAKA